MIWKILFFLTSCSVMQSLLQKAVTFFQILMGIGSGASVDESGEKQVVKYSFLDLSKYVGGGDNNCDKKIVFDVGANCGKFLDICLDLERSMFTNDIRFEYHVFEPARETFCLLQKRFDIKNNDIFLNQIALSDSNEERELYYDQKCSGLASLSKRRLEHFDINFQQCEIVYTETLDSYCKRLGIERIDLLKMDVEGYEMSIINGGKEMIAAQRIDRILFEFGGCNIDSRIFFQDFWYVLSDLYRIYRVTPNGFLVEIKKYAEKYEQFRTTNFFAIRKNLFK